MSVQQKTERTAKIDRATKETDISLHLEIDGRGDAKVKTGIPFFDHMLTLMSAHGFLNVTLKAKGDIEIDGHHTVEDVGIVLGKAFAEALGDKKGIRRYGSALVPMDEALVSVALDFSNRPFLVYHVDYRHRATGGFDVELVEEFLKAFVNTSGLTLHVELVHGENTHHIIEAVFKALGQALDRATSIDHRIKGVRSTKGVL